MGDKFPSPVSGVGHQDSSRCLMLGFDLRIRIPGHGQGHQSLALVPCVGFLGATRTHRCLGYHLLVSPGTVLSDESPCTKSTIGPQVISPISDVESSGLGMVLDVRLQARS
ncbi:hypothetical protein ACFX2I_006562 [Malus domestica]